MARVLQAEEFPDGRWALITVGTERFRVVEWLPDDPYPVAEIEYWPNDDVTPPEEDEFQRVSTKFRRCMALASEAGIDIGAIPDGLECGELGTMQMAAMLPVGPFDKQRLLGAPGATERLADLDTVIDEAVELIEFELRGE